MKKPAWVGGYRIHLWYIFIHLVDPLMANVGLHIPHMDSMGNG